MRTWSWNALTPLQRAKVLFEAHRVARQAEDMYLVRIRAEYGTLP